MKILTLALAALTACSVALADDSPEGQAARQCRSVHLAYDGVPPAAVATVEATVTQSAPGTYFCLMGFNGGYCGIQELYDGRRVAIFSVWDPGDPFNFAAHPDETDEAMRTKILYAGKGVDVSRFGGEGTGGKSMMPYAWETGKPVRMAVTSAPYGDHRTAYTCWIWSPEENAWFRMATFATLVGGDRGRITGVYSFVEDFRRNVESRDRVRSARFSRLWASPDGKAWSASRRARFTADNNLLMTIDAEPDGDGFRLTTGGKTANDHVPLWSWVTPLTPVTEPPACLDALRPPLFPSQEKTDGTPSAPGPVKR